MTHVSVCVCGACIHVWHAHLCMQNVIYKAMHAAAVSFAEECMKWAVRLSLHGWKRETSEQRRGRERVLSRDKYENQKEANFLFAQTCTQASVCFVIHIIAHLKLQTLEPNSYAYGSKLVCKPGLVNSVYHKIKCENKTLMMVCQWPFPCCASQMFIFAVQFIRNHRREQI